MHIYIFDYIGARLILTHTVSCTYDLSLIYHFLSTGVGYMHMHNGLTWQAYLTGPYR